MRGGPTLWAFAGVAWLVASLLFVVCSTAVSFFSLPRAWAVAWLVVEAVSLLVPLDLAPPRWAARFLRFSVAELRGYFPITLTYEDKDAFKQQRPFVIAYEPHSVLPLGMCVFTRWAEGMPPSLVNTHVASTSTVFLAPFVRHIVHWLGCRPASRDVLRRSLAGGTSVAICPGGVQECFYMEPEGDAEVVFLKARKGFVRLAMQAGAPLVPVFAFGQTPHYRYFRPLIDWPRRLVPRGAVGSFVRFIGYVPMVAWGWLGTAMPYKMPLNIVVGRPIEVPQRANPSAEEVERYLQQYIAAIERIFEQHKAAAGHPAAKLTIY